MSYVDGETLRQLRTKLGISQASLTAYIRTTVRTISRYEQEGTSNEGYVNALLDLIGNPRGNINPPVRRGRPPKAWTLVQPHRHSDYGEMRIDADAWNKCHFRLWYPGHSEHRRAIIGPPVEPGLMWLERKATGSFLWDRYRRLANGTAEFLDIVDLSME